MLLRLCTSSCWLAQDCIAQAAENADATACCVTALQTAASVAAGAACATTVSPWLQLERVRAAAARLVWHSVTGQGQAAALETGTALRCLEQALHASATKDESCWDGVPASVQAGSLPSALWQVIAEHACVWCVRARCKRCALCADACRSGARLQATRSWAHFFDACCRRRPLLSPLHLAATRA